jgi:hypothetical protein
MWRERLADVLAPPTLKYECHRFPFTR